MTPPNSITYAGGNLFLKGISEEKNYPLLKYYDIGNEKTVFTEFKRDFCAKETHLLMNHRSAPRLIELQKMMYSSLQENECDIKASSKWQSKDGTISLLIADEEAMEAQIIASNICNKISSGIPADSLPNII